MGRTADGYARAMVRGVHEHRVIIKNGLCPACDVVWSARGSSP